MSNPRPSEEALAAGGIDSLDLAALDRIEALYARLDPVPSGLVDKVQFGITLDALHTEIAELQRSSDLVGVRSDGNGEAQTVTFTSPRLTTMVTISVLTADAVRIDGWAVPGARIAIELRTQNGTQRALADEDGRFVFESVPRGIAQFVLRDDTDLSVVTPSIEL